MKRAISIAVFVVTLVALLFAADHLTRRDDGRRKYGPFYAAKEEQAFDVLFFGTSHVLTSVFPMDLWRDYGITSYNMGNNSEPLEMTKWVVQMALQYHKPKVALIDIFYIDRAIDQAWTFAYRHLFLDEIPFSPAKIRAVTATLPRDQWGQFLVPFSLYHGRWDEMITGDVVLQVDTQPIMMGAEPRIGREAPSFARTHEAAQAELPGTQAIRDMVAFLRENGVEPVLLCVPSPATEEEQRNCNSVYALAEELSVPFLHMLDLDEPVVDFETDCYDSVAHLNPDGAHKVTAYLGQWLRENYGLADHRGDSAYASWDEMLPQYEAYLDERWGHLTLLK